MVTVPCTAHRLCVDESSKSDLWVGVDWSAWENSRHEQISPHLHIFSDFVIATVVSEWSKTRSLSLTTRPKGSTENYISGHSSDDKLYFQHYFYISRDHSTIELQTKNLVTYLWTQDSTFGPSSQIINRLKKKELWFIV